jgi:hypothetical protein
MVDRASALAVMPLPSLATYFTASDLIALLQTGPPYEGLGFMGGPFAIGLLGIVRASRRQVKRRD